MATPIAIAINIHRVKYLSKKPNFFLSFAGAQLFADIFTIILYDNYIPISALSTFYEK